MRNIGVIVGTFPAGTGEVTVKVREKTISEAERQRRNQQRAMSIDQSIDQFCARYGVGRTTAYEEIKEARLRGLKCGKRTIITEDDAEDWLRRLPAIKPSAASERFGKNSAALARSECLSRRCRCPLHREPAGAFGVTAIFVKFRQQPGSDVVGATVSKAATTHGTAHEQ
jgi:hypothetical protein